jgi:hypothetical protein
VQIKRKAERELTIQPYFVGSDADYARFHPYPKELVDAALKVRCSILIVNLYTDKGGLV